MLTVETNTAAAANAQQNEFGAYPPPKSKIPPAAVKPEIAFVTDINGVCKAGTTPHTDQ